MAAPSRKSNWPALLELFLLEKQDQPFDWATNNCAFFACDWIAILTGCDPAASFRARVTSKSSAAGALAMHGGAVGIAAEVCAQHGWPAVPVLCAQRGDICAGPTEEGAALGVCLGARVAFVGPRGIRTLPLRDCTHAWKIS